MKKTPLFIVVIIVATVTTILIRVIIFPKGIPIWVKTDIGPRLHEFGRPALLKLEFISLGSTGFKASIGPGIYQDEDNNVPDYYCIDVEKQHGNDWYVYFQRQIKIEDLPNDFINKKISEVVELNKNANHVVFKIGNNKYEYTLSKR